MAKVKIQGHASGTGILTVTAPNTSTNRTITLPDSTDTLIGAATTDALTTRINATGGRKNLIINGAMQVAQRSISEASKGADAGYFTLDRMYYFEGGTTDVLFTQSQSTDVPTGGGFGKSLKFDCTTADASLAVDNQLTLKHRIEGQNIQHLKWGTSSAESVTLSFWIKSTKTGTYIVELSRESRKISQAYTVSSSDTWEKKTLTFVGDTGGSVVTDDSSSRLEINFYMGVGTNYSSGTLETTWTGGTTADRAVGQVNAFDNTSNNILFTGVQLELGTAATDYEHRSYGEELALCQRYFSKNFPAVGALTASNTIKCMFQYPVEMRANPSIGVVSGSLTDAIGEVGIQKLDLVSYHTTHDGTTKGGEHSFNREAVGTNFNAAGIYANRVTFDAEL